MFARNGILQQSSIAEEQVLEAHWAEHPVLNRALKPEPEVTQRPAGGIGTWLYCCPELVFAAWGVFAHSGTFYLNQTEKEATRRALGLGPKDPGWDYSWLEPSHYSECPEFSVLYQRPGHSRARSERLGLRWQALARDNFTCQYCGRRAGDVVLEVDHRISLANGGAWDLDNLVTSCRDCNRGKSKRNAP